MTYVSFETCLALAMVYILVEIHLAFHVHFETLAMAYILFEMHLIPHVLFGTLDMAYILIKMHLALAIIINILVKMHLAHNNILNVSFVTQTNIHYAFQIKKNSFHCNPMWLPKIIHKLVTPPPVQYQVLFIPLHTWNFQ